MPNLDTSLHFVDTAMAVMAALIGLCAWFLRGINTKQDSTNRKLDALVERIIRMEEWRNAHSAWCDDKHQNHDSRITHIEGRVDSLLARQAEGRI